MAENSNINQSPINNNNSSCARGAVITDYPKKRKFEEDQLEAPLPNHKTFERISGCDTSLKQESDTCMINEDAESERDSNSFVADPDPWESEPGCSTTSVRDQPSTTNRGSSSFESTLYSLDSRILTNTVRVKEVATAPVLDRSPGHGNIHFEEYPEFDEELLALEGLVDYSYAEYLNKCTSKEDTEEMPSSSGANQNVYVLSSGRWSVNPEPLLETKKPTIDQEFEEYFSSLML